MFRHFFLMAAAVLGIAATIAACSNTTPVPTGTANRTSPDAAAGSCTPPPGTGTCQ